MLHAHFGDRILLKNSKVPKLLLLPLI